MYVYIYMVFCLKFQFTCNRSKRPNTVDFVYSTTTGTVFCVLINKCCSDTKYKVK